MSSFPLDPQSFDPLADLFMSIIPANGQGLKSMRIDPPQALSLSDLPCGFVMIDPTKKITSRKAGTRAVYIEYTACVALVLGEYQAGIGFSEQHAKLRHWIIPICLGVYPYQQLKVPKRSDPTQLWNGVQHMGNPSPQPLFEMIPAVGNIRGIDAIGFMIPFPITEEWRADQGI